jgi:type I restriction enzyme S subunit
MSQAALVPKLRFSEFSDEWEAGYLNEFIDSLDAGVSVNSTDRQAESNEKCILKTSCVSSGVFKLKENKVVLDDDEIQRLKEPLQSNTIIISRMNTPALVGANAIVTYSMSNVFLPDRLWAAKINKNYSGKWLGILMSSTKFRAALSARATGTSASMKNITKGDVLSLKITYPAKPEQQKIAAFLTAVDNKIEQLSKKQELLGEYKKGAMQQIFSQAIRFKANDDSEFPDWEEKKLGDVCKLQGGYAFKSAEFQKHGIPIIRISNISNNNDFIDNRNLVYYNEIKNSDKFIIKNGDLIVAMSGATTGKSSIYNLIEDAYLNQRVGLFKANNSLLDYGFLIQIVFSYIFATQLDSVLVAGAQPNVSSKDIEGFEISLPSKIEQNKIANFLSSIDSKIEQVGKQLDESKQFKKALLQQMFV